MKLNAEPFEQILSGRKIVELRVNDEKRQLIHVGDHIIFVSRDTGKEIIKEVVDLHRADTFGQLFDQAIIPEMAGFESTVDIDKEMGRYYATETIKRYGVVGIELSI